MIDPNLILFAAFDRGDDWYSLVDNIGYDDAERYMKHYDGLLYWGQYGMAGVEYGDTAILVTCEQDSCMYMKQKIDTTIKRLGIQNVQTAHIKGTKTIAMVALNGERFKQ